MRVLMTTSLFKERTFIADGATVGVTSVTYTTRDKIMVDRQQHAAMT